MMQQAGKYRRRVEILTPASAPDAYGDFGGSLTSLGYFRCHMITRTNDEVVEGQATIARTRYFLRLRYSTTLDALTTAAVVRFGSRDLEVLTVENVEGGGREILITAEERDK